MSEQLVTIDRGELSLGEEVTRRNLISIRDYTVMTRGYVRDQDVKVDALQNQVRMLQAAVAELTQQVAILRGKVLNGGPTDGYPD